MNVVQKGKEETKPIAASLKAAFAVACKKWQTQCFWSKRGLLFS